MGRFSCEILRQMIFKKRVQILEKADKSEFPRILCICTGEQLGWFFLFCLSENLNIILLIVKDRSLVVYKNKQYYNFNITTLMLCWV